MPPLLLTPKRRQSRRTPKMLSLEREIADLRDTGTIGEKEAARLITIERRELFSVHPELRALLYAAVALITAGVAIYLRNNLSRISPAVLVAILIVAASGCYVGVYVRRRRRADHAHTLFDDYLLVLGALLLSAAVGYAEAQYHIFDDQWKLHLLILAVLHAFTAYLFDSRALLPLSIAALAAWFGITREASWIHPAQGGTGGRVLMCAGVVLIWRIANRRLGWKPHFGWVLEHFTANLALLGALLLVMDRDRETIGLFVLTALAALSVFWGIRKGENLFVIYGVIYLLVGIDQSVIRRVRDDVAVTVYLLGSTIAAILLLYWIRGRLVTR